MPRHQSRGQRFAWWWRKRAGARAARGGASQNVGCAYPASFGSSRRTCVQRRTRCPSAYIYTAGDYGLITADDDAAIRSHPTYRRRALRERMRAPIPAVTGHPRFNRTSANR